MKVLTSQGFIEREELTVRDVVQEEGNTRIVAAEWFKGDELVRRDVHVSVLAPLEAGLH